MGKKKKSELFFVVVVTASDGSTGGGSGQRRSIKNLWLWHWGHFDGGHGAGLMVGPSGDLKGLFQP